MYSLILDCAYKPVVSLLEDGKELKTISSDNGNHSDNYMLLIDSLLKEFKLDLNGIEEIVLNVGPGSFTGLRVAVSIAKGFGFGDDKNVLTFTSFDYINSRKEILLPGFSSFVYKKSNKNEMSCEDVALLSKDVCYVTSNEDLFNNLTNLGFNIEFIGKLSYEEIYKALDKKYLLISELEPLYLRKSQAELEKENKIKK